MANTIHPDIFWARMADIIRPGRFWARMGGTIPRGHSWDPTADTTNGESSSVLMVVIIQGASLCDLTGDIIPLDLFSVAMADIMRKGPSKELTEGITRKVHFLGATVATMKRVPSLGQMAGIICPDRFWDLTGDTTLKVHFSGHMDAMSSQRTGGKERSVTSEESKGGLFAL